MIQPPVTPLRTIPLLSCLLLWGCGASKPDVTTVMASGNCQQLTSGVSEIVFDDLAGIRGSQFVVAETPVENSSIDAPTTPGYRLIAVMSEPEPTAGYELALGTARFDGEALIIDVVRSEPTAGQRRAQVVSQPCLIVATTHIGAAIEVHDGEGLIGTLAPAD